MRVNREITEPLVDGQNTLETVFDRKKNLYSRRPLPGINRERVRLPIQSSSLNLNLVNWNFTSQLPDSTFK